MTTIEIFDFDIFQSWILALQILVKMEDFALIVATEHTTVHATVHIREKTAKKVSNNFQTLYLIFLVNDSVIDKNVTFIHLRS